MIQRYYEWYELQKMYPYAAMLQSPYNRFPVPQLDPRSSATLSESHKVFYGGAPSYSHPYCFGVDPRTLPGAGFDLSKYAKDKSASAPLNSSGVEVPKHTSPSSSSSSSSSSTGVLKRISSQDSAEVLDLSVKKRKLDDHKRTLEKEENMHKEALLALGRVPGVPLPNGGMVPGHRHAASLGLPVGYPPMWDLNALQQGGAASAAAAVAAASVPHQLSGFTAQSPYLSGLPGTKDRTENGLHPGMMSPYALPHLQSPCTSLADRERILAHLRL